MENAVPQAPWYKALRLFLEEAIQELKKVTWPGRKEILASSAVVLVVAVLFAVMVSIEDWLIHLLLKLFY